MLRRAAVRPYKLLSVLLRYPDEALVEAHEEIAEAVASLPGSAAKRSLVAFGEYLAGRDAVELAQGYVETFDLRRRTSLYLTYYLHGDTRKRGMALLRLKRRVEPAHGALDEVAYLVRCSKELAPALPLRRDLVGF